MAYIVDGNNVIGQTPGWHRDKAGARRALIRSLASFVRLKQARVTVVFDGSPDRDFPDDSAYRGVKVHYANRGSDADTRIVQLVESSRDPKGLTVVTSDRHLASTVRSVGAKVMRSGEFRRVLESADESQAAMEKEKPEAVETKAWLRYFGVQPDDDDDDSTRR
jgi:predicted RNA-binding protein with PIN domain